MKYLVAYVIGLEGQIGHSWEIGRREIERDTPIIGIDDLNKIEQDIEAHSRELSLPAEIRIISFQRFETPEDEKTL